MKRKDRENTMLTEDYSDFNQDEDTYEEDEIEYIDFTEESIPLQKKEPETRGKKKKKASKVNHHLIFLGVFVFIIIAVIHRLSNWGVKIDLEEFFKDHEVVYQDDTFDQILPLTTADGTVIRGKENPSIVFLGNAPFADDRESAQNVVNLIGAKTGATVYNCSVSNSYLAALNPAYDSATGPMDAFNFYWLTQYICGDTVDFYYTEAEKKLGDNMPPEAKEVFDNLKTIDFNTIDVIAIMYDASDYLAGHQMYSDTNATDIMQFTGNLEAGIELLHSTYPNIRIIVMSPTYAFGIDENGEYISSDIQTYGQDVLSTYVIRQCFSTTSHGVTFVDNLYGTITEENAPDYLVDNLHLNTKGRELVADRFIYALEYFN